MLRLHRNMNAHTHKHNDVWCLAYFSFTPVRLLFITSHVNDIKADKIKHNVYQPYMLYNIVVWCGVVNVNKKKNKKNVVQIWRGVAIAIWNQQEKQLLFFSLSVCLVVIYLSFFFFCFFNTYVAKSKLRTEKWWISFK